MSYRPFRTIGRLFLAACVVSLGAPSLIAQAPSAPAGPASAEVNPSRGSIFSLDGYSYFGAHGQVQPAAIRYSSINLGAIGSGAYYFNKYVGAEANFVAHPDGHNDGLYTTLCAGLIFSVPQCRNFTVFAHGLVGAAKSGRSEQHEGVDFRITILISGVQCVDCRRRYGL